MATWDGNNYYYSGQGVVLLGSRNADGTPAGLTEIGNVSSLVITVETSVLEHKESQTGQRAIDLRLTTETKCKLAITMENFIASNLADTLRGSRVTVAAGAVVGEASKGYLGKVSTLKRTSASSVVVKRGAASLVAYVADGTAYDYKVNAEAGSILINSGQTGTGLVSALTAGGTAPTAFAVGATTSVTVANTAAVGDKVVFTGFGGADAALINGKAFTVVTATSTVVTIDLNTVGKALLIGTPLSFFDGTTLTVDYAYTAQFVVDALTASQKELYMRFEGLNTADGNKPVIVEVFKFSTDPLKELALISDGVQQFVLEGNVLADPLQVTGSKFFVTKMVR